MDWLELHDFAGGPGAPLPSFVARATADDGAALELLLYGDRPGNLSRILRAGEQEGPQVRGRWTLRCATRFVTFAELHEAIRFASSSLPGWWAVPDAFRVDLDPATGDGSSVSGLFVGPAPQAAALVQHFGFMVPQLAPGRLHVG